MESDTGQKRNVTAWPEVFGMGAGAESLKYRFQWTFPVEISPHDGKTLYVCSNFVHRSTDDGTTWEVISPDLTRNDPSKIGPSGGPITADNSGAEIYCTIFAFRESPHEAGVFWAGSDDGLVHISRDNGANWQDITPPQLPAWAMISVIEPSPHDAATAYVAATCYKSDDMRPYLFKTNDYGATWTQITDGIPEDEFTRAIREDPGRRGLLYCGTELGIKSRSTTARRGSVSRATLPITPIWDLVVKGTDLVAATHGRSFWILDDITPLHQLQEDLAHAAVHLFAPRDTVRYKFYDRGEGKSKSRTNYKMTGPVTVAFRRAESASGAAEERYLDAGKNPPEGVIVHYWLRETPKQPLTVDILDADGGVVRSLSSKRSPVEAASDIAEEDAQQTGAQEEVTDQAPAVGPYAPAESKMNRFVWDYRFAGATPLASKKKSDDDEDTTGPRATPGGYRVRLTVDGATFEQPFTLVKDPRLPASEADLRAQFDLKLAIRDRLSETHAAINQIRAVREQINAWDARARDKPSIKDAARTARDALKAVEGELINLDFEKPRPGPNRLKEKWEALGSIVDESDDAPTRGAFDVYDMLRGQLESQQTRLREALNGPVTAFSNLVRTEGVPLIAV